MTADRSVPRVTPAVSVQEEPNLVADGRSAIPSRKWKTPLLFILAASLLLWLAQPLWLPPAAAFLVVADPLQPAAAVVPLSGDHSRIAYGAQLLDREIAQWLVLTNGASGPSPAGDLPHYQLARERAISHGVPESRIVISAQAVSSTMAEARALRQLARDRGWSSLLIVTSPLHTRRARRILRDTFAGTGITIIVRPVPVVNSASSSQPAPTLPETLTEYLKFAVYLAGYHG